MSVSLREIDDYVGKFYRKLQSLFSCILCRSRTELAHYFAKDGCRMFHVMNGVKCIGYVFLIVHGRRSIVTAVQMVEPEYGSLSGYHLRMEDIPRLGDRSCINIPRNRFISNLHVGSLFWQIEEYFISYKKLNSRLSRTSSRYSVAMLGEEESIDEILAFDYNLFSLSDRKDFLQTCRENSDVVLIVRKCNEIKGFGMISKPIRTPPIRIMGPVYVTGDEIANCIINAIYDAVRKCVLADRIIAYVPVRGDSRVLVRKGFRPDHEKRWTRLSSCLNYNINRRNIIALGSLAFDVC